MKLCVQLHRIAVTLASHGTAQVRTRAAHSPARDLVPVTADNFIRAETDRRLPASWTRAASASSTTTVN